MCDTVGCDNEAEWLDEFDNELCRDCVLKDINENFGSHEDYEPLNSIMGEN